VNRSAKLERDAIIYMHNFIRLVAFSATLLVSSCSPTVPAPKEGATPEKGSGMLLSSTVDKITIVTRREEKLKFRFENCAEYAHSVPLYIAILLLI
jgi:hypothetical protein